MIVSNDLLCTFWRKICAHISCPCINETIVYEQLAGHVISLFHSLQTAGYTTGKAEICRKALAFAIYDTFEFSRLAIDCSRDA